MIGTLHGLQSPATATILDSGMYSGTDSFSYDDCGFVVDVEVVFSGRFSIREGKNQRETAFFVHDNYRYHEVHTSAQGTITISGNGNFNETRAIPLGGNLFEFHAINAGQPFTIRDADGNILIRDRGVVRFTAVFDTEGDDVPGGIFISETIELGGPHPGFELTLEEFCSLHG
jgi:hypothetical protein